MYCIHDIPLYKAPVCYCKDSRNHKLTKHIQPFTGLYSGTWDLLWLFFQMTNEECQVTFSDENPEIARWYSH